MRRRDWHMIQSKENNEARTSTINSVARTTKQKANASDSPTTPVELVARDDPS